MNKEHLAHRARVKKRKPTFLQQDFQLKKLKKKWRRPKGIDSKRRLRKDGHQKRPSRGYSSPVDVRGLNPVGLREVLVYNVAGLTAIGKEEIAVISGTVGARKKIDIINEAKKKNIQISNVTEEFIKKHEEKRKAKQAAKKKVAVKVEPVKKETKKETPKKENKEVKDEKADTEKAKEEKKKVLEQKQTGKGSY